MSLLHFTDVLVDIKTIAAKHLPGSAGTDMEVFAQGEHMCLNEWIVLSSDVQFESVVRSDDRKCEDTPHWIPMFRH